MSAKADAEEDARLLQPLAAADEPGTKRRCSALAAAVLRTDIDEEEPAHIGKPLSLRQSTLQRRAESLARVKRRVAVWRRGHAAQLGARDEEGLSERAAHAHVRTVAADDAMSAFARDAARGARDAGSERRPGEAADDVGAQPRVA